VVGAEPKKRSNKSSAVPSQKILQMAASKTSDYDAKFVSISPEVQQALQKGLPIVALESTGSFYSSKFRDAMMYPLTHLH
jgi:hypothetical protein